MVGVVAGASTAGGGGGVLVDRDVVVTAAGVELVLSVDGPLTDGAAAP